MSRFTFILFSGLFMMAGCNSLSTSGEDSEGNTEENQVKNINEQDFFGDFSILDRKFGTETIVTIQNDYRVMKTNAIPNHITGDFPNPGNPNAISEQNITYKIPLQPKMSGKVRWAREFGVALNGVKFEPETAERFVCETGEVYRIEAFQNLVDLGLDKHHAHVQPTGAYHYHGAPIGLIQLLDKGEDLILVGFAHDGFPIYYSISGKYKPGFELSNETRTGDVCSYRNPKNTIEKELSNTNPDGTFVSDWVYNPEIGDLDECNGMELDGKYIYLVTDDYPYVGRCLKGEFKEQRPPGPPPGGGGGRNGPHGHGHPHPPGNH